MIPNKLGVHVDANAEFGDTWDRLGLVKPKAVTLLINTADPGKAAWAVNQSETQVIRVMVAEDNMKETEFKRTAQQNAEIYGNMIAPLFGSHPKAYWMYWRNEIGDGDDLEYHLDEMAAWIVWCAQRGVKAAFGGWSMGMPGLDKWPKIERVLKLANQYGALLVLHEYGVKVMQAQVDEVDKSGYLCLRYRKVWKKYGYASKYSNVKIFISEVGLDWDTNLGVGGPWLKLGVSVSEYMAGLEWYAREIAKDSYVVGATVFCLSSEDRWVEYNIQGAMMDSLMYFIANNPTFDGTPAPIPIPIPTPVPDPTPVPVPAPPTPTTKPVPGFFPTNGAYVKVAANLHLPIGWNASYHSFGNIDMAPEYDPFYGDPPVVRLWASWCKLDACLYQEVVAPAGALIELSADVLGWSSNSGMAHDKADNPMSVMLGLDPTGGTDYKSTNVVWATLPAGIFEEALPLYIRARVGSGGKITAFLRGKSVYQAVRNDAFFSNVKLLQIGEVQQPPAPVDNLSGIQATNPAALNFRCGPGTSFEIRKLLPAKTPLRVVGPGNNDLLNQQVGSLPTQNYWVVVVTPEGHVGFVAAWLLQKV